MPKCNHCRYQASVELFEPAHMSAYHDINCPRCGTTNVDTSDLNKNGDYGYGDDNFLQGMKDREAAELTPAEKELADDRERGWMEGREEHNATD